MRSVMLCKKKILTNLLVLLCVCFSASCAKEGVHKPTGKKHEEVPQRQTSEAPARSVNHSQRSASQALVEQGLADYRTGDLEKAIRDFQDAITIDGQNGAAYYYSAQVCMESDNSADAKGFLDKAEVLFADDEEWLEKIVKLRKLMDEN